MKIIQKTLSNGLRLVMVPQADAATATVLILVGTGSKYEKKTENGLSHFLEHMYFKGTESRPSAKILAEAFDGLGAISNAFTDKEYTGYYAKGNPAHTDQFIDILSDIYLHSTFPENEIGKEKGVVIEEINMYEDVPQYKAGENLFALMYGDQPAGWSVIGPKATINSFSRKDLIRYQRAHYTPENTIVMVAGGIDPKVVQQQVKTAFTAPKLVRAEAGIASAKATAHRGKKKTVDTQIKAQSVLFHKATDQAHLIVGFRSLPLNHPDRSALSLLSTLLGGGMSSRLFLRLREELGAAYYVHTETETFTDHGIFSIAAGIDKTRFAGIMESIIAELARIKNEPVSAVELTKAKEQSVGMMRLGLESSDSIAGFYGMQLLLKGEYKTPEQMTKEYMAVTPADIQRVARKLFVAKNANLSVVGPFEKGIVTPAIFTTL
jgi:predicted Zn-dependent peptidase